MAANPDTPLIALPTVGEPVELPVAGQAPRRRADALRNYDRVLCAARRLFAERGPQNVSMDCVAAEAGVGKGTIFRAFGDRSGLMGAILGEDEIGFQEDLIRGEPPLGPGADPRERITAFGLAYMDFIDDHLDLLLASELGPGVRYAKGPFRLYRAHLTLLVREAAPDLDAEYLADVLLAPLAADFFAYQRRVRTRSREELDDAWCGLVGRVFSDR